jgi:TetR/AcrR family transcriptional repressor of nem operon
MDTRTALLDSAERAARQRGYDGFSYADIARDVGLRKASIHHHFPTKADLALDLIDRYAARFAGTLSNISEAPSSGADKLRAYHALYREALSNATQLCLCVTFSAGRDSLSAPVLEALDRFHSDSIAWLENVFITASEDGSVRGIADMAADARATLALMEGAQLLARGAADLKQFDQATAAFLARLSPATTH